MTGPRKLTNLERQPSQLIDLWSAAALGPECGNWPAGSARPSSSDSEQRLKEFLVHPFLETTLKCTNFKCFSDATAGFDRILPINIMIGRNNSGKRKSVIAIPFRIRRIGKQSPSGNSKTTLQLSSRKSSKRWVPLFHYNAFECGDRSFQRRRKRSNSTRNARWYLFHRRNGGNVCSWT